MLPTGPRRRIKRDKLNEQLDVQNEHSSLDGPLYLSQPVFCALQLLLALKPALFDQRLILTQLSDVGRKKKEKASLHI